MEQTTNNTAAKPDNEVPLDELPVVIKAYKDENGYAIVIKSKEKRIGSSDGTLVDNFLVRVLDGVVPQTYGVHTVAEPVWVVYPLAPLSLTYLGEHHSCLSRLSMV